MRLTRIICLLAWAAAGCRSDSNEAAADAPKGGSPDAPVSTGTTIKQLLTSVPAEKAQVNLKGVVVITTTSGSSSAEAWVQDKGGGAQTGIHLYCNPSAKSNPCQKAIADVMALQPGDVIDVTGLFSNNNFGGRPDDYEVIGLTFSKTGQTQAPVAVPVDASHLGLGADLTGADFKAYMNTYVKVMGPVVIDNTMASEYAYTGCSLPKPDAGVGAPDAGPKADAGPSATYYSDGFEATAGSATIAVSLFAFHNNLTMCLPDCGRCDPDAALKSGDTFASVSGIVYGNQTKDKSMTWLELRPVKDADLAKP